MDDYDDLRAAHDRARARSLELLERTEHAAGEKGIAASNTLGVEAEPRDDDDDALVSWSRGMPERTDGEPHLEPARRERRAARERLTDSESARWQKYIDGKIAAANAERDTLWRDVLGALIAEVRKQMRAEHSAELAKLDLRLSALLSELGKRQTILEAAAITPRLAGSTAREASLDASTEHAAERAVFQLPRGASRFTHHGVNGNA